MVKRDKGLVRGRAGPGPTGERTTKRGRKRRIEGSRRREGVGCGERTGREKASTEARPEVEPLFFLNIVMNASYDFRDRKSSHHIYQEIGMRLF